MGINIALEGTHTNGPGTTYHLTIDGLTLYRMADLGKGSVEAAIKEALRMYLAQNGQSAEISSYHDDVERQLRARMNA